jgi:hypothetical protein
LLLPSAPFDPSESGFNEALPQLPLLDKGVEGAQLIRHSTPWIPGSCINDPAKNANNLRLLYI